MTQHHFPYQSIEFYFNDWAGSLERRYEEMFPAAYRDQFQFRSYSDSAEFLDVGIAGIIANKPKSVCFNYIKQAHQYAQINFELNLHPGKNFTYTVKGEKFTLPGKKQTDLVGFSQWEIAFYLAMILRDKQGINLLCEYEPREFHDPRGEHLLFDDAKCDFMKGLYNPNADLQHLLNEAAKYSGPEYMPARRQSYIYNINLPFIAIILATLANNQQEYEQAVINALNSHLEHFCGEEAKHASQGWISLSICAAAAIAYDQCGFKLPVASPYLPEWLIYGEFE